MISAKVSTEISSYGFTLSRPANFRKTTSSSSVQCSSSQTSSVDQEEVGFVGSGKFGVDRKGEFKYLVSEFGWKVMSLFRNGDEVRKAAYVQAGAFMISSSPSSRLKCFLGLYINFRATRTCGSCGGHGVQISGYPSVSPISGTGISLRVRHCCFEEFQEEENSTVVLKACDTLSVKWGFAYLALRAYEDDFGARQLYSYAGTELSPAILHG